MNTTKTAENRIAAGAKRLVDWLKNGRQERYNANAWESNFVCSEAPLCAELLRRSHDSGRD